MVELTDTGEILRQVARGMRPITDLESVGIRVSFAPGRIEVVNPRHLMIALGPEDIAHGLIRYASAGGDVLREWARLILEASSIYDLDIEEDGRGEVLVDALWSLTFDGRVGEEALRAARELIAEGIE